MLKKITVKWNKIFIPPQESTMNYWESFNFKKKGTKCSIIESINEKFNHLPTMNYTESKFYEMHNLIN
jgi:hypothetical protein